MWRKSRTLGVRTGLSSGAKSLPWLHKFCSSIGRGEEGEREGERSRGRERGSQRDRAEKEETNER